MDRWTACPGCGVVLPPEADPPAGRRINASAACQRLYGEVIGFEAEHLVQLGRLHQLTVDAYAAQHADGSAGIGTAFGLIGLHLALERGMSGLEVRDAHGYLANRFRSWPAFAAPPAHSPITIFDVAMAGSPDEHAALVQRWARTVWQSWSHAHDDVAALVAERLPAGRLRS